MESRRPFALTIAIVLLVLLSAINLVALGAPTGDEEVPVAAFVASAVLGVAGFVAAGGLWRQRRWGMIAAFVVLVLNAVSTAPALLFAPSTLLLIGAILSLVATAAAIILLVLPTSRRTFA
jgi:hypothetical protein